MPREGDRTPRSLTDWLGLADAPRWGVARPLGVALSVALALLFVLALVATVAVLRDALVDGEGGGPGVGALLVALLGAPFMIWTTVIRHETLRYQKEGHITDRIAKAVEQLGAEKTVKTAGQEESRPNIEVRIGAILALERIAQDSTRLDRGRDHVRVIEILCAYVRENSNARRPRDFPLPEWQPLSDDASDEERAVHEAWRAARFAGDGGPLARQWAEGLPRPRADVQLALRVIGRRSAEQRRVEAAWPDPPGPDTLWPFDPDFPRLPDRPINEPLDDAEIDGVLAGLGRWRGLIGAYRGYRLDLRGANLQRADLSAVQPDGSDAVYSGARLDGTRLEGALLRQARLEEAHLTPARLEGALLQPARLDGADLMWTRLEGADLKEARMERAGLSAAHLEGAHLSSARMEGAAVDGARVQFARLESAQLEGARFQEARMEGTLLCEARMERALLIRVRIDAETNLKDAVLRGAAFQYVRFGTAWITRAQIASTFGDASVTLPGGVRPGHPGWPAHWPVWILPLFRRPGSPDFVDEWRRWRADPSGYTPPPPPQRLSES